MGQIEPITNIAPDLGALAVSPVARHVALMRQDWREKLREYHEAEDAEIGHLPEAEQDAAFDRAGAALDALVGVRAADLHILAEKMRIVDKTGTVLASGYFEDLLTDVDELSHRAVFVPTKADILAAIKRGLKKLEPWFDWGRCERTRLDSKCAHFTDESWGEVRRFEVQWLGVHFAIELGRTPTKVSAEEAAARLASYRSLTQLVPVPAREPDESAWRAAVESYRAAEDADVSGMSREAAYKVHEAAGDAMDALAATRVPDLPALVEKMRIMRTGGTNTSDEYFEELIHDTEALGARAKGI